MSPRFSYYWAGLGENGEALPVYKMQTKIGRSDVTAETLLENGLPIPPTPTYQTWKNLVASKLRCGRCWAALRGKADLNNHLLNTPCGRKQ